MERESIVRLEARLASSERSRWAAATDSALRLEITRLTSFWIWACTSFSSFWVRWTSG